MENRQWRKEASVWSLGLGVLLALGCAPGGAMPGGAVSSMGAMQMDQASVQQRMAAWHPASQEAATFMMDKYGPPASMTGDMMVWDRTGPWKRTIVYREAVQHDFPMPHPDVMEQFIDYRMPPEMFDEIAMYDGSVILERTKGEMSARCDKEGANFLAVNLAHEIATGKRTVEDARRTYGEQIKAMKAGQPTPYTQGLVFTPPPSGNDPGRAIM
ncbi:MAG: hypothetical protein M3409_06785 [Gemmatimonadota bacterium]|nr:hypothetical protein [Gemmatimonadota bacterium]